MPPRKIMIDPDFAYLLAERPWRISSTGYVVSNRRKSDPPGAPTILTLHRVIMAAPNGMVVDHINGNRSDNRRCNLRVCTHAENIRNRRLNRDNTSGFKGVWRHRKRWRAEIKVNGKHVYLGTFDTPEEASAAYAAAAPVYHGKFARTA